MKKFINLYTDDLREKPVPYGFSMLVTVLLISIASMLAYGFWNQQQLAKKEKDLRQIQAREQALQETVTSLEGQLVKKDQIEAMEQALNLLRQGNAQRERLLIELRGKMNDPFRGFSPSLHALSSAYGQGVWLTRIQLIHPSITQALGQKETATPLEVRLSGRMHQGKYLPRYMDALAMTEGFSGLHFNSIHLLRSEDEKIITFLISTRAEDVMEQGEGR